MNRISSLLICGAALLATCTAEHLIANPLCPEGFDIDCGARCYRVVHSPKTWQEANGRCMEFGGNLAIIRNQEEQTCVESFLNYSMPSGSRQWIGLYAPGSGAFADILNSWQWINTTLAGVAGSPDKVTFQKWIVISEASREPNGGGDERCVEMISDNRYYIEESGPRVVVSGGWNNMDCATWQNFICEIPKNIPKSNMTDSPPPLASTVPSDSAAGNNTVSI